MGQPTYDRPWREVRQEVIERIQPWLTATIDQVLAFWRDAEPMLRAFVAAGDQLGEQDWLDIPEDTRALYTGLKDILTTYDQEMTGKDEGTHGT